jgi:hypothetical protein
MTKQDAIKATIYQAIGEVYDWLADGCAHEWRNAGTLGHTVQYCVRCHTQKVCNCPNDGCTDGHICGGGAA